MALTFPLSLSDFYGGLRLLSCELMMPPANEMHRSANGELHEACLGSRLWEGTVNLAKVSIRDGEALRAKLNLLRQAGASFLLHPFLPCGPRIDRNGVILGSSTPTIHTLDANNRELRVQGLPEGYQLSGGDFLSFTYGSPARHAMHQIVSSAAVADVTGVTPLFEVVPHIRPGAVAGAAVTLIRPVVKAIVTEFQMGNIIGPSRHGISFSFIQKVKAG